jgi:magnesium transporter
VRREILAGLALGGILALIGVLRILLWHQLFGSYGETAARLAVAVGLSLVGVVAWGTLSGSSLPFLLRAMKFDPASASAPFVATLVDVSGLVIYFTIAGIVLGGHLV